MTPKNIETIVESQLTDALDVADVRSALVPPYLQDFIFNDTYEQMAIPAKRVMSYWVVAIGKFYSIFYDPSTQDFGLADVPTDGVVPHTQGVRGDLVSTFRAM